MSSLTVEEDQRWVPTHVLVTVLRGRALRGKGKHGTSDVYTIIQLGKEKYSTGVAEKTTEPEWREECTFELQPGVLENGGYPAGSRELILTVMHRALIGQDVFLGQAVIHLDKVFQESRCLKNEWYRLNSKSGKKEKERGEIQVTIQFTRNNLTASMYDLVMKDKGSSTFSKLKERIKGKRRSSDDDSSSAVLPGGYGSLYRLRQRLPSDGGGEEDYEDDEGGEARRSKMRTFFFRGKLRKSSDTRSSTSLGSESSESSSRGGSLSPTAGISVVVSDLSNSPSNSSNLTVDNSPEHTANISPKSPSFKCAFGDEAGEITIAVPQPTVCVNRSHSYNVHPLDPGSGKPAGSLGLGPLQKSLPLSVSLQNLSTRASMDLPKGPAGDGRRWSFDRAGEEEKAAIAAALEQSGPVMGEGGEDTQPKDASSSSACKAEAETHGKKQRRNLFSHGWSEPAGKGQSQPKDEPQQAAAAEERQRGWFGSKESHSKPSLVFSPNLEPSTDPHPPPPPPRHHPSFPLVDSDSDSLHHTNPFCHSQSTPPLISSCNPFFARLQRNPFYEDVLSAPPLKPSPPPLPYLSSSRPPITQLFPQQSNPNPVLTRNNPAMEDLVARTNAESEVMKKARPLPPPPPPPPPPGGKEAPFMKTPNPFLSVEKLDPDSEWDECFEAFAAGRLQPPQDLSSDCPTQQNAVSDHPLERCDNKEELSSIMDADEDTNGNDSLHHLWTNSSFEELGVTSPVTKTNSRHLDAFPQFLETIPEQRSFDNDITLNTNTSPPALYACTEIKQDNKPTNDLTDTNANPSPFDASSTQLSNSSPDPGSSGFCSLAEEEGPPCFLPASSSEEAGSSGLRFESSSESAVVNDLKSSEAEDGIADGSSDLSLLDVAQQTVIQRVDDDRGRSDNEAMQEFNTPSNGNSVMAPGTPTDEFSSTLPSLSITTSSPDAERDLLAQSVDTTADPYSDVPFTISDDFLSISHIADGPGQDLDDHLLHAQISEQSGSSLFQSLYVSADSQDYQTCDSQPSSKRSSALDSSTSLYSANSTLCGELSNTEATAGTDLGLTDPAMTAMFSNKEISQTFETSLTTEDGLKVFPASPPPSDSYVSFNSQSLVGNEAEIFQKCMQAQSATLHRSQSEGTLAPVFDEHLLPSFGSDPSSIQESSSAQRGPDFPFLIPFDPESFSSPVAFCTLPPLASVSATLLQDTGPKPVPEDTERRRRAAVQQNSPHPVKPLTAAVLAEEKRSVLATGLEKLKSTIHPGRSSQLTDQEVDKRKTLTEGAGSYYHLTHSELVALLVQREAELDKQRAEFEHQKLLLAKRELELKRLKPQVRDLEDYIDTLLVRIMEQKPTLLQVRSKFK